MFGRIKSTQSRTDCYLTEMLRAMLREIYHGEAVFILQSKLHYEPTIDLSVHGHSHQWVVNNRGSAICARNVSFAGFFLCDDTNRSGMPVRADFTLTLNHMSEGWDILRTIIYVGPDKYDYHFGESYNNASPELKKLSSRLRESFKAP